MSTSQLGDYVADLALHAKARQTFATDADAAMVAANLSPEAQDVLRTGKLTTILDYLDDGGVRPADPDRQPGNGSGSGGSGSGGGSTSV